MSSLLVNSQDPLSSLIQGLGRGFEQTFPAAQQRARQAQSSRQMLELGKELGVIPEDLDLTQFDSLDPGALQPMLKQMFETAKYNEQDARVNRMIDEMDQPEHFQPSDMGDGTPLGQVQGALPDANQRPADANPMVVRLTPEQKQYLKQVPPDKRLAEANRLKKENVASVEKDATARFVAKEMGLDFDAVRGLTQSALNGLINQHFRKPDVETPNQTALKSMHGNILKRWDDASERLRSGQQSLSLSKSGEVGLTGLNFRSIARMFDIPIPDNATEAMLSKKVVDRMDELKKKFGARVTDFDFESWMKGQPSKFKTQAANIALSLMQVVDAERDQALGDASLEIASDPNMTDAQKIAAMRDKEKQLNEAADNRLVQLMRKERIPVGGPLPAPGMIRVRDQNGVVKEFRESDRAIIEQTPGLVIE